MTIEKFKGLHPSIEMDDQTITFVKGGGDPPPWPDDGEWG